MLSIVPQIYSPQSATITSEFEPQFIEQMCISSRFSLTHATGSNVFAGKFSPDGKLFAVSYADGSL